MIKTLILLFLKILLFPCVVITAPIFYLVSRTGIGISICRKFGFQPLLVHYYSPIPQYELIPESYFTTEQNFPGFKIDRQKINVVMETLASYQSECDWPERANNPSTYYSQNPNFGYSSAAILHSMIRAYQTKKIIEIGSGYSSLISLEAIKKNYPDNQYELICIEPFPSQWLTDICSSHERVKLLSKKAESVNLEVYLGLEENDILFIDSSHVAKLNSDVNFLFLQVLPRLSKNVIIHIHDIYIPYEYPQIHFYGQHKKFWNEQYMLQAFMTNNNQFEIIFPGYYVQSNMAEAFQATFPKYNSKIHRKTSSFWLKKVA